MEKYIEKKEESQEKKSHMAEMLDETDFQLEFIQLMQAESKTPQPSYIEELEEEVQYLREQLAVVHEELTEKKAFLSTAQREMHDLLKEVVGWRELAQMQAKLIAGMKKCEEKRQELSSFFSPETAPTKQLSRSRGGFEVYE